MNSNVQDDEIGPGRKGRWLSVLDILLAGLVLRGGVLLVRGGELAADPDDYRLLAETFGQTGILGWPDSTGSGWRPTAFRPPLYSIVLASLAQGGQVTSAAIGGLHWLLGAATMLLTYLISQRCRLGRWGLLAVVAVACDPILLNQSSLVMTETMAACLAALGLYCLTRLDAAKGFGSFLLAGAALGLAVLCRPSFLPWVGLACLGLLGMGGAGLRARKVTFLVGLAVTLMPWIVRNHATFGRLSVTTTHGGYTLLLGNNPLFYNYLNTGRGEMWDATTFNNVWDFRRFSDDPGDELWAHLNEPPQRYIRGGAPISRDEFEDDRFAYQLAWHYIRQQPLAFSYSCAIRAARLWQLLPTRREGSESWPVRAARFAVATWYGGLFLLALLGAGTLRAALFRSPWLWGVLLLFSFTAVHSLYWSNMRMRAPLMPFVCLLAAAGAKALAHRWRRDPRH